MWLVWDYTHWNDLRGSGATIPPVVHVVTCGSGSWCTSGWMTWCSPNFGFTVSNLVNELVVKVILIYHHILDSDLVNTSPICVRVLSLAVISPNENILDFIRFSSSFFGNLIDSTLMFKARESCEVFVGNQRSTIATDKGVSHCWITHNQHFYFFFSNLI